MTMSTAGEKVETRDFSKVLCFLVSLEASSVSIKFRVDQPKFSMLSELAQTPNAHP
jgi:hypothetical protein